MPSIPQRPELEKMIERAMLDSAPAMHRELRESGELSTVIKDRAEMAEQSYAVAMDANLDDVLRSDDLPMERVGRLTAAKNIAASEAIRQACEFAPEADDEDTEIDEMESEQEPLSQVLYWNQNSGGKTDVTLTLKPEGSLELFYYDIGSASRKMWGDSDYERWITIPPEALPQLAFRLIAEKYDGRFDSVSDLQKFCEQHSVAHTEHSWA